MIMYEENVIEASLKIKRDLDEALREGLDSARTREDITRNFAITCLAQARCAIGSLQRLFNEHLDHHERH